MRRFFIVGSGRSGTTLLQQALNRHSGIIIPPETGFFVDFLGHTRRGQARHLRRINDDLGIEIDPPKRRIADGPEAVAFYDEIAQAYLQRLGRLDATCFGDKSPHHVLVLPRIARLMPDVKFILMYRDGRDVALSLSQVPWAPNDLYVNFAIWLRCWRWQRWAESAGLDLMTVQYESFVRSPEAELRRVAAFLEVEYEPAMAQGSGNREGIPEWEDEWKRRAMEPISAARIGQWRDALSPRQIALLERWGAEALTRLGYELTTGGHARLPPSFFPMLYARHAVWRARCAWRLLGKELLGR